MGFSEDEHQEAQMKCRGEISTPDVMVGNIVVKYYHYQQKVRLLGGERPTQGYLFLEAIKLRA